MGEREGAEPHGRGEQGEAGRALRRLSEGVRRDHELPIDPDTELREAGGARPGRRAAPVVLAVVSVAGALGALVRDAAGDAIPTGARTFPWGTLVVNLTGSLAIGFVLVLLLERFPRARLARPLVVTGFLGAYTTFSSYVVQAVELVRNGAAGTAAAYVVASAAGGLAAVALGMGGARLAIRVDDALGDPAERAARVGPEVERVGEPR